MKKRTKVILIIIALLLIVWFLPVVPMKVNNDIVCYTSSWIPGGPESEEEHSKSEQERCDELQKGGVGYKYKSLNDIYNN